MARKLGGLTARAVSLAAAGIVLAGCGSTSDIVRAGPDTYMITAGGGMYEQNPAGMKQEVYERANAHCDAMGKTMIPGETTERAYQLGRHTASTALTFKCQ